MATRRNDLGQPIGVPIPDRTPSRATHVPLSGGDPMLRFGRCSVFGACVLLAAFAPAAGAQQKANPAASPDGKVQAVADGTTVKLVDVATGRTTGGAEE